MDNNIAVFGGSFNPPTLGHSRVLSGVAETRNNIDRIILLPSGVRSDKDFGLQMEQRKILLDAFYEELLESNLPVEIDTYFFEGKNGNETTTVQEDAYFKETRGIQPEFIYGSDVISNMPTRKGNIDKYIEHKLSKIFVHRPGYQYIDPDEYDMKNYRLIEISDLPNVSSTLAKEVIYTSQSIEGILHPKIAQLIKEHQFYK